MSLINDALKKAKQAQKKSPPPPAPAVPHRPAETTQSEIPTSGMLWPLALAGLAAVVVLMIWFALRTGGSRETVSVGAQLQPAAVALKTVPAASSPTSRTLAAATKPVVQNPAPLPTTAPSDLPSPKTATAAPFATPTQAGTTVTAADPGHASTPAAVVPSEPPAILATVPKLQGIFYRPDRPAAVLSGKTVFVGSTTGDYRVVAIDPATVTLVRAGQTNVLSLAE
jgi:outer membrane protein assembly factor BamB